MRERPHLPCQSPSNRNAVLRRWYQIVAGPKLGLRFSLASDPQYADLLVPCPTVERMSSATTHSPARVVSSSSSQHETSSSTHGLWVTAMLRPRSAKMVFDAHHSTFGNCNGGRQLALVPRATMPAVLGQLWLIGACEVTPSSRGDAPLALPSPALALRAPGARKALVLHVVRFRPR